MSITLHQLNCFLAVAQNLSFGDAARALRISPSSLSEQISKLETTLERRLFDRAARGVTVTRSGTELMPMAQRVLTSTETIVDWAKGDNGASTVVIGVAAASAELRRILALANERLPSVRFQIRPVGFNGGLPALLRREIDCAVVFEVRSLADVDSIHAVPLWREKLFVVLASSHRLAAQPSIEISDLWGEVLLAAIPSGPGASNRAEEWYGLIDGSLLEECTIATSIHGPDDAVELVAAGGGVNIAGESARSFYARDGVTFVPLNTPTQVTATLIVMDEPSGPMLREFVEIARSVAVID